MRFIAALSLALLAGASLPELPGEPPEKRTPRVTEPFLERSHIPGPRPYWESDPLFIPPP